MTPDGVPLSPMKMIVVSARTPGSIASRISFISRSMASIAATYFVRLLDMASTAVTSGAVGTWKGPMRCVESDPE